MSRKQTETLDDLQNGYMIRQAKDGFRFGIDAVLLADFACRDLPPKDGAILDLGCGNGILPLLIAARLRDRKNTQSVSAENAEPSWQITGLEIRAEEAARASRNILENRLEEKIRIREGDLREAESLFDEASFDLVVSNPPYRLPSEGKVSPNPDLAIARHEVACTFDDVARAAAYALRPDGKFCLVHRSAREDEILETLRRHGLAPTRLCRVQPFADRAPNLFLAEAKRTRTGGVELSVDEPLVVYQTQGVYSNTLLEIYGMTERK